MSAKNKKQTTPVLTTKGVMEVLDNLEQDFGAMADYINNNYVDDVPWDAFEPENYEFFALAIAEIRDHIEAFCCYVQGDDND